jgi:prophage regulatory protein
MRILRLPQVEAKTGLKHTAIYQRIAEGSFPRPIPLGRQARGFVESEVDDWIKCQIAKRDSHNAV